MNTMTTEKLYTAFLRNYYLSSALYDFIFAYAIYTVLFSIHGLSPFQISLLLAWWSFTSLLLEVPSGALADYWNRRKLLIIAPLVKSLCLLAWYFADGDFYVYGLGFLFWSIGSTFVSGTSEALLYDHVVYYQKKHAYEKVLGRKKFYFYIGQAVAVSLGGIMAHYHLEWTLIFSVFPLLLSSFFAFLLHDVPQIVSTEEFQYVVHIKHAYQEVKQNRKLVSLFVFSFGISIFGSTEEFDQLYYELVHLPLFYFGFFATLYFVVNAVGANYAYTLRTRTGIFHTFPIMSAICFLALGLYPNIFMLGFLLFSYLLASPLRTLTDAKIQHCIQSESRATITSIDALLINLFSILFVLGAGVMSKIWDLEAIYISAGVFLLVFAVWAFTKRKVFV